MLTNHIISWNQWELYQTLDFNSEVCNILDVKIFSPEMHRASVSQACVGWPHEECKRAAFKTLFGLFELSDVSNSDSSAGVSLGGSTCGKPLRRGTVCLMHTVHTVHCVIPVK